MADHNPHVVLFPFPAQGHINPFISLANLLHHRRPSLTITVVSTPLNIQSICSSLPPTSSLLLHSLPFSPSAFGLPTYAESTGALNLPQFITFFHATKSLLPHFEDFIASIAPKASPLCIISDTFVAWTVDVAREHNAYHSLFTTSGAFGTAVFSSLWTHLPHTLTEGEEFSLPDHPEVVIHRSQLPQFLLCADGNDEWSTFFRSQISLHYKTDSMLVNTVEEFEYASLSMLRKVPDIPVWPIGPLTQVTNSHSSSPNSDNEINRWLDSHPRGSVLYISFGSQNTIQVEQMMELAMGLDRSNRPFIWMVRPPEGFGVKDEFRPEWLPPRFEERVKEEKKGILVHGWAPQADILAHESLGAFLSHCGWNSVLESLSCGVPIIAWPLSAEQFYNAKMMVEECGVCVEIARGRKAKVEEEKVAEVVEMVMGENEKGREMKRKAEEIKKVMRMAWRKDEGSSEKAFTEFLRDAGLLGD